MSRTYDVAIIGAGYVGLPLAETFADAGRRVLVVDVVPELVAAINAGESHIEDVSSESLRPLVSAGKISASADYEQLRQAAAILIALPTPLTKQREPESNRAEGTQQRGAQSRIAYSFMHDLINRLNIRYRLILIHAPNLAGNRRR